MAVGLAARVPRKWTRAACGPTCFLVTETHQHFSRAKSKPGHYVCPLVIAENATQENPSCVLGVTEAHTSLMLNLTPDLAELLRPQTCEPYKVSLLSSCHSGLATAPHGWQAVVSPRSFPELVWAVAGSVSRLRGYCFLKSKQAAACWRMGATSTPDSRMAGQVVNVPQLPERLRMHTARVAMCAGPDPARPIPEG